MPVIDGTAPRFAPFAIALQFAPVDLPADTSWKLSPLVACLQPIDSVLASKSTLGILDRLRPTVGALIQPSLNDA